MSRARHATTGHCFGLPAGTVRASRAGKDGRGGRWDFGAFLGILGGLNDEKMADFWLIYGGGFFFFFFGRLKWFNSPKMVTISGDFKHFEEL